jgi:hypothetical protein
MNQAKPATDQKRYRHRASLALQDENALAEAEKTRREMQTH